MARLILCLPQLMVGLSAVIAGAFLAGDPVDGGPLRFPEEWLDGSPFADYLVPGIVLGLLGAGMLGGAYFQVMRLPLAPHVSLVCGVLLDLWILVQVTIVPLSLMQPGTLVVGTLIAVMAFHQLQSEQGTPVRSSKVGVTR
jgi:hypothetical protein